MSAQKKMSGGVNSIEAVKKKIKVLQDQAEEADERAERLQREVEKEKRARDEVHTPAAHTCTHGKHLDAEGTASCLVIVTTSASSCAPGQVTGDRQVIDRRVPLPPVCRRRRR